MRRYVETFMRLRWLWLASALLWLALALALARERAPEYHAVARVRLSTVAAQRLLDPGGQLPEPELVAWRAGLINERIRTNPFMRAVIDQTSLVGLADSDATRRDLIGYLINRVWVTPTSEQMLEAHFVTELPLIAPSVVSAVVKTLQETSLLNEHGQADLALDIHQERLARAEGTWLEASNALNEYIATSPELNRAGSAAERTGGDAAGRPSGARTTRPQRL